MATEKSKIDEKISALLKSRRFDPNIEYPPDKIFMEIGGQTVGTSGNVVTIIGPPKIGKSSFLSAMIASFFMNTPVYTMQLLKHRNKDKIAVFDTEQSGFDISKHLGYIKKLCKKKTIPNFDLFSLREDFSAEIIKLISCYLEENPDCGIIILDGLIDMVIDINNVVEAQYVMRLILKWASKFDVLFICIFHTGKGKELNSLGHLGSFCDRKSQSILQVEKNKDGSRSLKCKFTRASPEEFEDVTVMYNKVTKSFYCIGEIDKIGILKNDEATNVK